MCFWSPIGMLPLGLGYEVLEATLSVFCAGDFQVCPRGDSSNLTQIPSHTCWSMKFLGLTLLLWHSTLIWGMLSVQVNSILCVHLCATTTVQPHSEDFQTTHLMCSTYRHQLVHTARLLLLLSGHTQQAALALFRPGMVQNVSQEVRPGSPVLASFRLYSFTWSPAGIG